MGSVSSRFGLSLNDRWLLLREIAFWGATAPSTRTWRALTPASRSAKIKLCNRNMVSMVLVISSKGCSTYRSKVDQTHHQAQDPCRDNDPPECHTKSLLTHGVLVQIAQNSSPKHEHRYRQGDESRILSEQWPIPVEVVAEEGEF